MRFLKAFSKVRECLRRNSFDGWLKVGAIHNLYLETATLPIGNKRFRRIIRLMVRYGDLRTRQVPRRSGRGVTHEYRMPPQKNFTFHQPSRVLSPTLCYLIAVPLSITFLYLLFKLISG